ncbi:MAG: gliding motility-associated protein GldL [Bacteroidetes bacterium]|nr:gliding motility-associated protein GldL [Bacteroidota bacterium]
MGLISFMQTDAGKNFASKCYGFGASLVIIGALFKIQHYPLAGYLLSIGMGTEAFLFAMSGLEKPHKDYEWEKVFPHFVEDNVPPITSGGGGTATTQTTAVGEVLLGEEQVKRLNESIKNLSDTAIQLTSISKASNVTDTYVQNIQAASDAAGIFAKSQSELASSTNTIVQSYKQAEDEIGMVAEQSKAYATHVNTINKNLSSLNAVYELQLKGAHASNDELTAQIEHQKTLLLNMEQLKANLGTSLKDSEEYKTQMSKLARQVSDLNNVYGNMLNALNTKA